LTINEETALKEIKSRGYWKVKIIPSEYQKKRFAISECKKIVIDNQVRLRGVFYPHTDWASEIFAGDDYAEYISSVPNHKEVWRLYQSGQFIQYRGFWEDWLPNFRQDINFSTNRIVLESGGSVKSILMTLYTVTEIFSFMARLASKYDAYKKTDLSIRLSNVQDRSLVVDSILRTLHRQYVCRTNEINYSGVFSASDLIGNSHDLALDVVVDIFQKFNWDNADLKTILKTDQEKFLKGII